MTKVVDEDRYFRTVDVLKFFEKSCGGMRVNIL
jgi:hypothetical protein